MLRHLSDAPLRRRVTAATNNGYHAMAVSMITGHGDPEMTQLFPATVPAERVALVGLHEWTEDAYPHIAE
ncbi:hypothetical protein OHA79_47470 (plasmid) [Streptomyces sp. NBC_00841]|uniref:hypothetical protein n=1 Tax=unclassified Streptomyces TaxID=2593676 RepID=UPI0022558BB4|nr:MULTISPECIES: hypothetical protein [unclassified Streptomyces]MCX4538053.1 hypothetical protein [Streptomyces sp. NBC_01669]WSA05227.1 hypothetical protein OHA79_47470 [Streptomyces sp. NBC_00841]